MRDIPATVQVIPTNLAGSAGQMTVYDGNANAWEAGTVTVQSMTTEGMGLVVTGSWTEGGGNLTYYAWRATSEI